MYVNSNLKKTHPIKLRFNDPELALIKKAIEIDGGQPAVIFAFLALDWARNIIQKSNRNVVFTGSITNGIRHSTH